MKRTYETPKVDKLAFNYRDQVVAASGMVGSSSTIDTGDVTSTESAREEWLNNLDLQQMFNSFWDWFTSLF